MSDALSPLDEMTTRAELQAHFDARSLNTHDPDAVAAHFAEAAVQRRISTGTVVHGRDAIRAVAADLFSGFPDLHVEVRDMFASGKRMCAELTLRGTFEGEWQGIPPTHRRMEIDNCFLFRFGADGLVEEETIYGDAATLMRQLGLG